MNDTDAYYPGGKVNGAQRGSCNVEKDLGRGVGEGGRDEGRKGGREEWGR